MTLNEMKALVDELVDGGHGEKLVCVEGEFGIVDAEELVLEKVMDRKTDLFSGGLNLLYGQEVVLVS